MASQAKLSRVAINHILVATDFSPESQSALQCAVSLAMRRNATIFLTHVLSKDVSLAAPEAWPAVTDAMRHDAEKNMAHLESTKDLQLVPHEVILRSGDTWDAISHLVADKNIDLIVMGTQGLGGVTKLLLGSTAERVIRHATCPVITVGPHARSVSLDRLSHILCASDFSSGSMRALHCALSLAQKDGAELTLLHVVESNLTSVPRSQLLEWEQEDRKKLSHMVPPDADLAWAPEIEVAIGTSELEILRLAESAKAELIVMGCHPGGVISTHLPWTTLHQVLQQAHCPVLTVRGEWPEVDRSEDVLTSGGWFIE